MTGTPPTPADRALQLQAPENFLEKMTIPEAKFRTAIAIKNDLRTREVTVTFSLKEIDGDTAIYSATCPRCNTGELIAYAKLNPDGGFAEHPACPTLCLACEERLDEILEPGGPADADDALSARERMNKYLQAMTRP